MAITVRIPTPLRRLTQNRDVVTVTGANIGVLVDDLDRQYPGIKERLCDDKGELRKFVNIYLNDEDIRFAQGLQTPVKDGDELAIIPAIAGGVSSAEPDVTQRVWLTYPKKHIERPVIWELGHKFDVVTNILQGSITPETGILSLDLTGTRAEIKRAILWLERLGVRVEPVQTKVATT